MMPARSWFLLTVAGAVGCSHQQPVARTATAKAAAARPTVLAGPAREEQPARQRAWMDIGKRKEGPDAIFFDFDSALVRDDGRFGSQRPKDLRHGHSSHAQNRRDDLIFR
jgi:hypothetical protein